MLSDNIRKRNEYHLKRQLLFDDDDDDDGASPPLLATAVLTEAARVIESSGIYLPSLESKEDFGNWKLTFS